MLPLALACMLRVVAELQLDATICILVKQKRQQHTINQVCGSAALMNSMYNLRKAASSMHLGICAHALPLSLIHTRIVHIFTVRCLRTAHSRLPAAHG
jgi:uncharacterized protein involved in response to NO